MATQNDVRQALTSSEFMDTMIRLGAIGLLLILCLQVFSPFAWPARGRQWRADDRRIHSGADDSLSGCFQTDS